VIIDRTTAGASEIVAGAILENKRGELIGERTVFGMGAEQELFPLDDGSALLLTYGSLCFALGQSVHVGWREPDDRGQADRCCRPEWRR
jgi:carboxyl-terminal processing protease